MIWQIGIYYRILSDPFDVDLAMNLVKFNCYGGLMLCEQKFHYEFVGKRNENLGKFIIKAYEHGYFDTTKWLNVQFRLACERGYLNTAKWLFQLGDIDIHAENNQAMQHACNLGNLGVAKWLITTGATPYHISPRSLYDYHKLLMQCTNVISRFFLKYMKKRHVQIMDALCSNSPLCYDLLA